MKLIAVTELRYAAVNYFPGDEFEGSDNDAMLLKAIGKAKDAPARPVVKKAAKVEPAVAQPSPPPAQADAFAKAIEDDSVSGRRRYMRRDMTAGEE